MSQIRYFIEIKIQLLVISFAITVNNVFYAQNDVNIGSVLAAIYIHDPYVQRVFFVRVL